MMREMSNLIIKRRIKDERIGFVSVTGVDVTADLSTAVVKVSLFGAEDENRDTWKGLVENLGWFQSEMGRALRLRVTPRLRYEIDTSIAEGDRILDLIEQQNRDEVPES